MLKSLELSQIDWKVVELLTKNLKPLFDATVLLSGKNYPTLSISKFEENVLFHYFENASSEFSSSTQNRAVNEIDATIKNSLNEQFKKYFDTNTNTV